MGDNPTPRPHSLFRCINVWVEPKDSQRDVPRDLAARHLKLKRLITTTLSNRPSCCGHHAFSFFRPARIAVTLFTKLAKKQPASFLFARW
jgi:hypothetical protein